MPEIRDGGPAFLTASMPEDVKGLVEELREPPVRIERLMQAATDLASLSAKVEELTQEVAEFDSANRDIVKRADFWKARAETAEASLAERDRIIAEKDADLRETLQAVLFHFGPEGASKVTGSALEARAARDRRAS